MNPQISYSSSKLDKTMNPEQFNQVVEAILAGKYSWACVLILRFAGYNPLHYIPYRTYNRLTKENCQLGRQSRDKADSINTDNQNAALQQCLSKITDLDYLDAVDEPHASVRGGNLEQDTLLPVESVEQKNRWLSFFNW